MLPKSLALLFAGLFGIGAGCAPATRTIPEHASWSETESGDIAVRAGDVVRIKADGPLRVGEIVRSGSATVELWRVAQPDASGAIHLRAGLSTTAFVVPRVAAKNVHVGRTPDPAYGWFDLESEVLAWADGEGGRFPNVAAKGRIDVSLLERLPRPDTSPAKAIRRVAALRAIRTLRPFAGLPWVYLKDLAPSGATAKEEREGHELYRGGPKNPLSVSVEGPVVLHVLARVPRANADRVVHVRLLEGTHERAAAAVVVSRLTGGVEDVQVRPLVVHVPPHTHDYRIELDGDALVRTVEGRFTTRMFDAKSETKELAVARRACDENNPALCAMALALSGADDSPAFRSAIERADAASGAIARALARGPNEPLAEIEARAQNGSASALAELGERVTANLDEGTRESWARATLRATAWRSLDDATGDTANAEPWIAAAPDPEDGCTETPKELGATVETVTASPLKGGNAIALLVTAPCDDPSPITLDVDGEALSAQPSAGRALWHVVVKGKTARVKRTDRAKGQVTALPGGECRRGSVVRGARLAATRPEVRWDAGTGAPGIEIWLRAGVDTARVEVTHPPNAITIVARAGPGLVAIDPAGVRFTRVARVPLPAWATAGVSITGDDKVAIRGIGRGPRVEREERATPEPPEPIEVAKLAELSRTIATAPDAIARASAYGTRALALARAGHTRAATEDAQAAADLGASVTLAGAMRSAPAKPFSPAHAYGIEPDFDPGAARCAPSSDGARARMSALVSAIHAAPPNVFDPTLAARAVESTAAAPDDPRATSLVTRALAGSRWKVMREGEGAPRVTRPRDPRLHASPTQGDGLLRADVAAGMPFESMPHAVVVADQPARASLAGVHAKVKIDFVCAARAPSHAKDGACRVSAALGGTQLPVTLDATGRGSIAANATGAAGRAAELAISVESSAADHAALVRIAFDKEVPGTKHIDGVGWVLDIPHVEHRFLLGKGNARSVSVTSSAPAIFRVDARSEEGPADVVAVVDGREEIVPVDGDAHVVASKSGRLTVTAKRGVATVAIAERVARAKAKGEEEPEDADDSPKGGTTASSDELPPTVSIGPGGWRDAARSSPEPRGWIEDRLGTLSATSGVWWGTLREGEPSFTSPDGHLQGVVTYRRHVESIGLFTALGGIARFRDGEPTYGGSVSLYERPERNRLRASASVLVLSQTIAERSSITARPRAMVEYVQPIVPSFYLIPSVGYDGYYTNIPREPSSTRFVDDDVYNRFRYRHESLAFAQVVAWWVPYFDHVAFFRLRGNIDVGTGQVTHLTARPTGLFAFGQVELSAFVDGALYPAIDPRPSTTYEATFGGATAFNGWAIPGSIGIRPGVSSSVRANDGGWQMFAFVDLAASFHRGLRDFTLVERPLPESLSGGVPWHGRGVHQ